jgi:UrcA family protein
MKTILLAAVAAASLSAAPAFAQTQPAPDAGVRIEISPAGLDLATAQGRAALDLRVLHAARTACGTPSPADALGLTRAAACVVELRLAAAARRDVLVAQAQRPGRSVLAGR